MATYAKWAYCDWRLIKRNASNELEERWQKDPKFLNQPEEQWPNQQVMSVELQEIQRKRRKTEAVLSVVTVTTAINSIKFSKWKRLVRVTAWILRYVQNLRCKRKPKKEIDPLTSDELVRGEEFWIKTAQGELHKRVEKEFNMLGPFTDEKGIIRVGGQADKSILLYIAVVLCVVIGQLHADKYDYHTKIN